MGDYNLKALRIFSEEEKPLTAKELSEKTGKSPQDTRRVISELLDKKRIYPAGKKPTKGRYAPMYIYYKIRNREYWELRGRIG